MKPIFTEAELAELRAADEEIDRSFRLSADERRSQNRRDKLSKLDNAYGSEKAKRAYREANRDKIAEAQRAYYEANRDKIAEAQRAYREANRDKIAEAQRAYREANRDKIAEIGDALRRWRAAMGYSQADVGAALDITQRAVSYWERGEVPIDFDRIRERAPYMLAAW